MIELLVLIIGIVLVWKFSSIFDTAAKTTEAATQGWMEDVLKDSTLDRQDRVLEFREELKKYQEKYPDFKITSHEDFLKELGYKD
jgi:hypothetical protein